MVVVTAVKNVRQMTNIMLYYIRMCFILPVTEQNCMQTFAATKWEFTSAWNILLKLKKHKNANDDDDDDMESCR